MAAMEEQQNSMPKCKCCQPKLSDTEARIAQLGRGLFGGQKHSDEETIDIISIEIEKIRGIMTMSEGAMPQAKRDMLGIALKEKEIQLKMLREKHEAKKEAERAKKLEDEAKAAVAEEARKTEEGTAAEAKSEKVEPPKISLLIKE